MIVFFKKLVSKFFKLYYKCIFRRRVHSYGSCLKINNLTKVTEKTIVGDNFNSNGLTIIGKGSVTIGDNFHCGFGCVIITENHNHNGSRIPYDETYIIKDTIIEDNVWLGINVIILPGVTIGEGAIIQAGSVVVGNVEKLAIVGGHPAKNFAQRNSEHYFSLKEAGMFH